MLHLLPIMKAELLAQTGSLCAICKRGIPAEIVEQDNRIYLRKTCPEHGEQDVLIASDAAWYHDAMRYPAVLAAPGKPHPVDHGCPFDCGPCESHQQKNYLPVVPVTSACNLDCPICYTINKNDGPYYMSTDEFARVLDSIRSNDPDLKIINFTGGEPTLHPQFTELIRMCHRAGIHRVTISTHGMTFIGNEPLLEELAELNARIVLSFNSFEETTNVKMLGGDFYKNKRRVLELLEQYHVDCTLLPVLALGCNDQEVGALIRLMLESECIRSLEIHTMTFTGQSGMTFDPNARVTVPDVLRWIEQATAGRIALKDFVPSPCAHPMCYQTCYLLETGDKQFTPFARFMSKVRIRELLTGNLYMEPGETMERILRDVIDDLWAANSPSQIDQQVLITMRAMLGRIFPERPISYPERQRIAERAAKTIYIHSHMDDTNFDTARIRQCCVGVPDSEGGNTPTCSYNILYRGRDPKFAHHPLPPIGELTGGHKFAIAVDIQ